MPTQRINDYDRGWVCVSVSPCVFSAVLSGMPVAFLISTAVHLELGFSRASMSIITYPIGFSWKCFYLCHGYQHPCIWTVKKNDDVNIISLSLYIFKTLYSQLVPASTILLSRCFLLSFTRTLSFQAPALYLNCYCLQNCSSFC